MSTLAEDRHSKKLKTRCEQEAGSLEAVLRGQVRLSDTGTSAMGPPLKAAQGALHLAERPQGACLPVGMCPATRPGRCLSGESNKTWACALYVFFFLVHFGAHPLLDFSDVSVLTKSLRITGL